MHSPYARTATLGSRREPPMTRRLLPILLFGFLLLLSACGKDASTAVPATETLLPVSTLSNPLAPFDSQAAFARVEAFLGAGQYDSAIAELTLILSADIDPITAKLAYLQRGQIYGALGQDQAALGDYDAALAIDSHDPVALEGRASIWLFPIMMPSWVSSPITSNIYMGAASSTTLSGSTILPCWITHARWSYLPPAPRFSPSAA
jgi:tetratricopeptide (TPR) repeat protein